MTLSQRRSTPHKRATPYMLHKRDLRARKKVFILFSLGNRCWWPGCSQTDPSKLHAHHPNHDRSYHRGLTSMSWVFIKAEIPKLNLLCDIHNGLEATSFQNGVPQIVLNPNITAA